MICPQRHRAPRPGRWGRWLLLGVGIVLLLLMLGLRLLDPWLRQRLEKAVTEQTHGQYRLQIGELHTSFWQRAIRLQNIHLQPVGTVTDTLPHMRLDLARLHLTGVGLLAVLQRGVVPIDSVVLDSLRLDVAAWPRQNARRPTLPLYQRLPLKLDGLRLGVVAMTHTQASFGPAQAPIAQVKRADFTAHDVLISAAGAADTMRLFYAASAGLRLQQLRAVAAGHHITLNDLQFSSTSKSLRLDSLRVRQPEPGEGTPGAAKINLVIPRLAIGGWEVAAMQHQRRFRADTLRLAGPHLAFVPPAEPPPVLWKLLSPLARRFDLAYVGVTDADLRILGLQHRPAAQHIFFVGNSIRVDSASERGSGRILYASAWTARTGRLSGVFDAPLYQASIAHMRLNTTGKSIYLSGLKLVPTLSPVQMNQRKGYQISQLKVQIPLLAFEGIDFVLLAQRSRLRAARMRAERPVVRIASDGRGPITPYASAITPEAVRRVRFHFDVRRFDIRSGNMYFRYRSPRSPLPGTMRITRFNATLRNVSNNPQRQTFTMPLTGTATAWLQDRCRMSISVVAPLLDPQGRHRAWGSFGPAPFGILNPMTAPTRFLSFKSGDVHRLDFQLRADKKQVTGTVQARYEHLQLDLLGYKNGQLKQPLLKRIFSKAANVLVIRDENPRKRGKLIIGDMTSPREPKFAVFSLWRQGLVTGLLNSIGLPKKLARQLSTSQDKAPLPTGK